MAARNKDSITDNAQEIGYMKGKIEMLEKKFDEHRVESKQEMDLVITKLDEVAKTMSFWRHTLWLFKVIGLSIPLIATANFDSLANLWKEF